MKKFDVRERPMQHYIKWSRTNWIDAGKTEKINFKHSFENFSAVRTCVIILHEFHIDNSTSCLSHYKNYKKSIIKYKITL